MHFLKFAICCFKILESVKLNSFNIKWINSSIILTLYIVCSYAILCNCILLISFICDCFVHSRLSGAVPSFSVDQPAYITVANTH